MKSGTSCLGAAVLMCLYAASSDASAQTYSKTEVIEYHDDLSKWVLGQVKRVTVNGVESSKTDYDANSLPWRSYSFGLLQQTLTYYADGTLATITDGRNQTTHLSGWKRGVPQLIQYPDGRTESAVVNDAGWIKSVTDESGVTTNYEYDAIGRLSLIDYPDGDSVDWASTTLKFEQVGSEEYGIAGGHWRQTVSTGAHRKTTYFDALWRPIVEREEDTGRPESVRVTAKRYDHEGRVTDAYYPQSGSFTTHAQFSLGVHTTYDALGRPRYVKQDIEGGTQAVTETRYEPGFETLVIDPRGQQTRTRYMTYDEPTYSYPVSISMPEGVTTAIARNAFFMPTQISRAGTDGTSLDRFYFYDVYQRLCRTFEPETGSTVTEYDGASNVAWSATGLGYWGEGCHREDVAEVNRIKNTYDARNRLTFTDYPEGTDDVAMSYEPTGEVKTARLGSQSEWVYRRNKRGLVVSETLTNFGDTQRLSYEYDVLGNLARATYPSGRVVDYVNNALGQPLQVGGYAQSINYYPDGDVRSFRYGNGIAFARQKNVRGLASNLTYASGSGALLYSQDLGYDANANLTSVSDLAGVAPSRSKSMTYDGLDRLKTATAPALWGTESFSYNALDNIVRRVRDGQVFDFVYDSLNRLRDVKIGLNTVNSYWYDLRGNMTCRRMDGCLSGGELSFDLANRLKRYDGLQSYAYDVWGRRVSKVNQPGGEEIQSIYSQGGQLMWELDSATKKRSDYVYLGKTLIAKVADVMPAMTAPATSGGGHTLSWGAAAGAVRYVVQESAEFGPWTTIHEGTELSWSVGGLKQGTYRYRVLACTADGLCSVLTSPHAIRVTADITPIIYELLLD